MEILILFCLASIGLTHILVDSTLFQPVRDWISTNAERNLPTWAAEKIKKLIGCYQCMGFWCGLFTGWMTFGLNLWVMLLCGFSSSFLSIWAALYLNKIEAEAVVTK